MWVENKVEKGIFFKEIKGGTGRTEFNALEQGMLKLMK